MCDSLQSHHQTRLNSNFPQHVFSQTHVGFLEFTLQSGHVHLVDEVALIFYLTSQYTSDLESDHEFHQVLGGH